MTTGTAHVAVLSPAFAVMVAVPVATAVTTPSVTVATFALDVVQVTVLSVALSGLTVAVRVAFLPTIRVISTASRATEVTGMVASLMVMTHRSSLSATWAVMVTSPGFRAFTLPSSTVAKYSLDEIQSMFLLVASSGRIVACSVYSPPTVISSVCWSSVTEVTGMKRFST